MKYSFPNILNIRSIGISIIFLVFLASCQTVKPYERQFINDAEMQMGTDAGEEFVRYIQSIRESAKPAQTSKGNGGCGCN